MNELLKMFEEFEEEQKIPKKIIKPIIVKKIIKKETIEEVIPEKIKVDRKKSKSQLNVDTYKRLKKDQELPKHKQKIPMEINRAFNIIVKILEKR